MNKQMNYKNNLHACLTKIAQQEPLCRHMCRNIRLLKQATRWKNQQINTFYSRQSTQKKQTCKAETIHMFHSIKAVYRNIINFCFTTWRCRMSKRLLKS